MGHSPVETVGHLQSESLPLDYVTQRARKRKKTDRTVKGRNNSIRHFAIQQINPKNYLKNISQDYEDSGQWEAPKIVHPRTVPKLQ
jgi:hypothetical protein